jgi:hypothetical protein
MITAGADLAIAFPISDNTVAPASFLTVMSQVITDYNNFVNRLEFL